MASTSEKSLLGVGVCNLLMASLFALSASFQFNDSDWYFWIPLYATACAVNLSNWSRNPNSIMSKIARFAFLLGVFLFIKVSVEDFTTVPGFWSLNMKTRTVRERFGSGLVISSMFLFFQKSNRHRNNITRYGEPILVGIAYGLSFLFFAVHHHKMEY